MVKLRKMGYQFILRELAQLCGFI